MVRIRPTLALALAWWIAGVSTAFAAAKTDIVELTNGDRITCEIKKLDRGKLTVKTDGLGTIADRVGRHPDVTSTARFDIELKDGRRTFGSLASAAPRSVDVVDASQKERLALGDIVRIAPLGGTLWKKARRFHLRWVSASPRRTSRLSGRSTRSVSLSQPQLALPTVRRFAADLTGGRGFADPEHRQRSSPRVFSARDGPRLVFSSFSRTKSSRWTCGPSWAWVSVAHSRAPIGPWPRSWAAPRLHTSSTPGRAVRMSPRPWRVRRGSFSRSTAARRTCPRRR